MNDVMHRLSFSSLILVSGPLLILIFGKYDLAVAEGVICIWVGLGSACVAGKDAILMIYTGSTQSQSNKSSIESVSISELDQEIADSLLERRRVAQHLTQLDRSIEDCRLQQMMQTLQSAPSPYRHASHQTSSTGRRFELALD